MTRTPRLALVGAWVLAAAVLVGCSTSAPVPAEPVTAGDFDTYPQISNDPDQPVALGESSKEGIYWDLPWSQSVLWWDAKDRVRSFGLNACLADGPGVVVDRVSAMEPVGSDVSLLGVKLATIDAESTSIISAEGFPPKIMDAAWEPAEGARLTGACRNRRPPPQQIVVGMRAEGPDGGGWVGVVIDYHEDNGTQHTITQQVSMLMCGEATVPCDELGI